MFRYADMALLASLICSTASAAAQTIADYSRSQRAAIDATIARQTGRASTLPTLAAAAAVPLPALPAAGATAPSPSPAPAQVPPNKSAPDAPHLGVSGAFLLPSQALAEVQVDGVSFILPAGEAVPGTDWIVERVEEDRVVLVNGRARRAGKPAVSRTFMLASARP